jgi:hypothetical protein
MLRARAFLLLVTALILALAPALALAQGLDQTFTWAETGLSIAYPAGWASIPMDEQTVILSSNPDLDPTAADLPPLQAVMILRCRRPPSRRSNSPPTCWACSWRNSAGKPPNRST